MLEFLHDVGLLSGVDSKIVVVGDGPSRQTLQEKLKSAIFTGNLKGESLGSTMASLDLLVTTGEHETFCQVIQEGMACGLPVISPRAGGPIDLIDDGVTGLLYEPGNGFELRKKVLTLISSVSTARKMGEMGHAKVAKNTWESVCAELVAHYEEVIRTKRQKQAS